MGLKAIHKRFWKVSLTPKPDFEVYKPQIGLYLMKTLKIVWKKRRGLSHFVCLFVLRRKFLFTRKFTVLNSSILEILFCLLLLSRSWPIVRTLKCSGLWRLSQVIVSLHLTNQCCPEINTMSTKLSMFVNALFIHLWPYKG